MIPQIELYAELLTNIRTVTLHATLRTESNEETKAELSGDGQTITISHEGSSASIRLPLQMKGRGSGALILPATPATPSKELTLRLSLEELEPGFLRFAEGSSENVVPWPASAMTDRIECFGCGTQLVREGKVKEWRDLPNENWAEMMDFWHCHKPHEHGQPGHEHDDATKTKGYSASSKLEAFAGVGFVGLSYFILSETDCSNIKSSTKQYITSSETSTKSSLHCEKCGLELGIPDPTVSGWKLYKWSIRLRQTESLDSPPQSFSPQKWISSLLLSSSENTAVRRFVVEPTTPISQTKTAPSSMLLWLFTPDLSFSSSHQPIPPHPQRKDPTRAIKLLHKALPNPSEFLSKNSTSHEHLLFPSSIYIALLEVLEESKEILPREARKFQDWDVGLLERFSLPDVGVEEAVIPAPEPFVPREERKKGEKEENPVSTTDSTDPKTVQGGRKTRGEKIEKEISAEEFVKILRRKSRGTGDDGFSASEPDQVKVQGVRKNREQHIDDGISADDGTSAAEPETIQGGRKKRQEKEREEDVGPTSGTSTTLPERSRRAEKEEEAIDSVTDNPEERERNFDPVRAQGGRRNRGQPERDSSSLRPVTIERTWTKRENKEEVESILKKIPGSEGLL